MICRFVDLVKAVNAWVRSAFGNVFFFYEVECDFTAIFKRENKPAEGGQYLLDGKERCSESRSLPKILAIIAPKAAPSIIDCTMVFSRHLCAFGFILFCVAIGVPYIVRTMSYSERNIFAIKERRIHVYFRKVPQIKLMFM